MAPIGEMLSRMLSAGRTQGLSRDGELVLPAVPELALYNGGLRWHRAEGDLARDPGLLWDTGALFGRRGGLGVHLMSEAAGGLLGFSDVLVIVNREDWRRTLRDVAEPWVERANEVLRERFEAFLDEECLRMPFSGREPRFTLVEDGGLELHGESLDLKRGLFVTGLLPNHYGGMTGSSRRNIVVHLHIPGAWEGFREVGALHSDQTLFTMGSHWLDNFTDPSLEEPALYRLHQDSDGSVVHVINPEVRDRYRITEGPSAEGPSVIGLERSDGQVIAWMILQVLHGAPAQDVPPARPAGAPAPQADVERLPALDEELLASRTIIPQAVGDQLFRLDEVGALLQRVHFSRFMEGYDVYLDASGRVTTDSRSPSLTLRVRGQMVTIEAHVAGVSLDGVQLRPGASTILDRDGTIAVGTAKIGWRDLSVVKAPGWPYLGELRRSGTTNHLTAGRRHRVGREPRCAVRLPDETHNANIVWRVEVREGSSVRSRNGDIPKSRFYIDSIMVASEHAEVDLSATPKLRSLARDCYSYVRRGDEIIALHPRRTAEGPIEALLEAGDELLIGNCVLAVGEPKASFSAAPTLDAVERASAPAVSVAVVEETLDPASASPEADPSGMPAAAGLGEAGTAPPPLAFGGGPDSLLGSLVAAPDAPTVPGQGRRSLGLPEQSIDAPTRPSGRVQDLLDAPTGPSMEQLGAASPPSGSEAPLRAGPGVHRQPVWMDSASTDADEARQPATAAPAGAALPVSRSSSPQRPSAGPSQPMTSSAGVSVVDESAWQHELSRPARLVVVGWMVTGAVVVGNHSRADVVIPESRSVSGQQFRACDYLELYVRGRRGRFRVLADSEAVASIAGESARSSESIDDLAVRIHRRDEMGNVDFDVGLHLGVDAALPDPRARVLAVDRRERMTAALFTIGLPFRQSRQVQLGAVSARATATGDALVLEDYLASYRTSDGNWQPFFIRRGAAPFRTVPEDGAPLELQRGDQLISGRTIYAFDC